MQLTSENYYSQEANQEYMSVSGYKDFAGTYGKDALRVLRNGEIERTLGGRKEYSTVGRKLCRQLF